MVALIGALASSLVSVFCRLQSIYNRHVIKSDSLIEQHLCKGCADRNTLTASTWVFTTTGCLCLFLLVRAAGYLLFNGDRMGKTTPDCHSVQHCCAICLKAGEAMSRVFWVFFLFFFPLKWFSYAVNMLSVMPQSRVLLATVTRFFFFLNWAHYT